MTYTAGQLIQAADYNGFVSSNAANVNGIWSTGSGDYGYGQTAISTVSAAGTVTATQWATLVNTLSSIGSQQNTSIVPRTAPTTGVLISILPTINTDITNLTSLRNNAVAVGAQYTGWTGTNSQTAGASGATWSITFTNTVTSATANAARYFFNAGGMI